jgi:putative ATP-dependent endonuclease of the OLD family
MAKIEYLSIRNFRSIKELNQRFSSNFVCLIGRGDSGKSTILEGISAVLSPNWNLSFFDNDFYNCETLNPIAIEVTLTDIPEELLREDKFGLYIRWIDDTKIHDEPDISEEVALTIRLEVSKHLEPRWEVVSNRDIGNKDINANDRAKFNLCFISDYIDRHFSWTKGGPLYTLLKQEQHEEDADGGLMIEAFRDAKTKIDSVSFGRFDTAINKVKTAATKFGLNIEKTATTIDFKDLVIKDGKVCLHDEKIPFRLKGKGSKRLISLAIQSAIVQAGGIVLVDEIEQGLEPDRVQQVVNSLKENKHGQVFLTTHSRDVLVELSAENIYLCRPELEKLLNLNKSMQGAIRKNPEAFFARKIMVCEGATELGICRAINEYRIQCGKKSMSYLGARAIDGGGSELVSYTNAFRNAGFETCLFCDSDDPSINTCKASLRSDNVYVVDWSNTDCLEMAIMRDLPFELFKELLNLVADLKQEDTTDDIETIKLNMWNSIRGHYGKDAPENLNEASDTLKLRIAIKDASVQKKKEWFKSVGRGYHLGKFLLTHIDKFPSCKLKQQLLLLSNWIDL